MIQLDGKAFIRLQHSNREDEMKIMITLDKRYKNPIDDKVQ